MSASKDTNIDNIDYTKVFNLLQELNMRYVSLAEYPIDDTLKDDVKLLKDEDYYGGVLFNTSGFANHRGGHNKRIETRHWNSSHVDPIKEEDRKPMYCTPTIRDFDSDGNPKDSITKITTSKRDVITRSSEVLPVENTEVRFGKDSLIKTHLFFFESLKELWSKIIVNLCNRVYKRTINSKEVTLNSPNSTNYLKAVEINEQVLKDLKGNKSVEALYNHLELIEKSLLDVQKRFAETDGFYDANGLCSRSCQTSCQSLCQTSCQNWCTNCHNQHCGLA